MGMVKIKIDGCEIFCKEGESILNAARANDIFIPAICYLSCCSPTLACKMCMVEADGKRVYACNAKVKDGMEVIVNTIEIEQERYAIMQTYNVNHPLQCGVCDKSGECELQNYTHYVGVKEQKYALRDDYKVLNHWGKTAYDPNFNSLIWSEDEAKEAFEEIEEYIDILFINIKHDSKIIIDSSSVNNIMKYLWDKGISTIIVKTDIEKGYYIGYQGKIEFIKYTNEDIIDNTGAGDAFNGGVIHGITSGMSPFKSANLGAIVAGLQTKKFGAIKSIPDKEEVYKILKGQDD